MLTLVRLISSFDNLVFLCVILELFLIFGLSPKKVLD